MKHTQMTRSARKTSSTAKVEHLESRRLMCAVAKASDIFFDGTRNDGVRDAPRGSDTNVYKMYQADDDRYAFKHYEYGVGTRTHSWIGGLTGEGADDIEQEAMGYLTTDLNAGAKYIDIIGFSRGAVEALDFGNQVAGLLKAHMFHLLDSSGNWVHRTAHTWKYLNTSDVHIRFIGLFDPVDSFGGLQNNADGDDLNVPPGVTGKVSDAVALSEHRYLFNWVDPTGGPITMLGFKGAHADIGGGYGADGISNITLHWMMGQATSTGMHFTTHYPALTDNYADSQIHDSYTNDGHGDSWAWVRQFPNNLSVWTPSGNVPFSSQSRAYWDPDLANVESDYLQN